MINPLSAQRLKEFCLKEYGTVRAASEDSGRSEQILAKMTRGVTEISNEVLRNFQRKKRLNTNWIHTGTPPMLLSDKDVQKNLVTDLSELRITAEHLKGQHLFYKKMFTELLSRVEKYENRIQDQEEDIKLLNKKVNEQNEEIMSLKRQLI